MRHVLFCFQELNAVYNLKQEQEIQSKQSHLSHNLQNTISGADNNFESVQTGDTSTLHQTYFEVSLKRKDKLFSRGSNIFSQGYGGQYYPEQQLDTHQLAQHHQQVDICHYIQYESCNDHFRR